jgi:diacylglycerol kinase (ATP)
MAFLRVRAMMNYRQCGFAGFTQERVMFLIRSLKRFSYAIEGVAFLVRTQSHARVHLLATIAVCMVGVTIGLARTEWLWITAAIVMVWSAEAFNTALEQLADALHPERHPAIGHAKDVAAGAVLIAAMGAAVIGMLVFAPHLVPVGG